MKKMFKNNIFSLINESDDEDNSNLKKDETSSIIYTDKLSKICYNSNKSCIIDNTHDYYRTQMIVYEYTDEDFGLTLNDNYPETAFVDINNHNIYPTLIDENIKATNLNINYKIPNHWGQRKLLLLEIDFLTKIYEDKEIIVIYAGAAPGTHLPILLKLFPKVEFHLYDPKKFDAALQSYSNIKINPYYVTNKINYRNKKYGCFNNDVAQWYSDLNSDKKLYFISDIRTVPNNCNPNNIEFNNKFEREIIKNQTEQMNWISIMKPELSIMKFKLPYPDVNKDQYYRYLRGEIQLQIWAPTFSSETRILISKSDLDYTYWYDIIAYERKLAYYNYIRQLNMNQKVIDFLEDKPTLSEFWSPLVDNINDFTIDFYNELLILKEYYTKFVNRDKSETVVPNLRKFLEDIIYEITYLLNIIYIEKQEEENSKDYKKIFRLRKSFNDNE